MSYLAPIRAAAYIGTAYFGASWGVKAAQVSGYRGLALGNAIFLLAANALPPQHKDRQLWLEKCKKTAETNRDHFLNKAAAVNMKNFKRDFIASLALFTLGMTIEVYEIAANTIVCQQFNSINEADQFVAGHFHEKKFTAFGEAVEIKACREERAVSILDGFNLFNLKGLRGIKEMADEFFHPNATAMKDAFLKFDMKKQVLEDSTSLLT